jgi:hypothetical protein
MDVLLKAGGRESKKAASTNKVRFAARTGRVIED